MIWCCAIVAPLSFSDELAPGQILMMQTMGKQVLYAPKRDAIYKPLERTACPFCVQIAENQDELHLVVKRFEHCVVFMSLYPLTKGHMLIVPYRHVKSLTQLSPEERAQIIEVLNMSVEIAHNKLGAIGCNVGINMGPGTGATVPDHLHMQVLPRYPNFDFTYIHLISNNSVITWDMPQIWRDLHKHFEDATGNNLTELKHSDH